MTKKEFLKKMPGIVKPYAGSEEAQLVVSMDSVDHKGAFYRHVKTNCASYGTYGRTWQEVYDIMIKRINS